MISIIVAVSKNGVIGNKGEIPWRLPADLKRFSTITKRHPVIMGRKTWESLPEKFRPLPERTNILITRQENYQAPCAIISPSLEEAIKKASGATGNEEVFIIGGAEIYKLAFPKVQKIYLTKVEVETEGDAYFPKLEEKKWQLVNEEKHEKDSRNEFDYNFLVYERRS